MNNTIFKVSLNKSRNSNYFFLYSCHFIINIHHAKYAI